MLPFHRKTLDRQKIIYLVDDDEAVRDSARMLLEAHGMTVRDFDSAATLLEKTRGEGADCLLLDLHMPGLNGIELLELLRKRGILVPAIILTGRHDPLLNERITKAGVVAVMHKPVDSVALLDWIARVTARGPEGNTTIPGHK